jgi:hypothetical protein
MVVSELMGGRLVFMDGVMGDGVKGPCLVLVIE